MDQWGIISALVGSGISLGMIIYVVGFRLGTTETKVKAMWLEYENLKGLGTKVETLWDVYVISALRREKMGGCPMVCPEMVRKALEIYKCSNCFKGDSVMVGDLGFKLVQGLGPQQIDAEAAERHLSFGQVLAQLVGVCLKQEDKID